MMHTLYVGDAEADGAASDGGTRNCKTSSSRLVDTSQTKRDDRWEAAIGLIAGHERQTGVPGSRKERDAARWGMAMVTAKTFQDIFELIAPLLAMKVEQEAQIAIAARNLQKHGKTALPDDAQQDAKNAWEAETARLSDLKEEKEKPTSFADKGDEQQSFIDTADYSDRVFSSGKSEMSFYNDCRHFQGHSQSEVDAALLEVPPRLLHPGNIPFG